MDGEVIAYISRFSFFYIENESRGGSEGAMDFEFFFFFSFQGHVQMLLSIKSVNL